MTFTEILVLVVAVIALYYVMRPLQKRLESFFLKFFRSKDIKAGKTVINITDYKKKED